MGTEKKIRNQAKDALNGNWTAALSGLFLIFAIILMLFLLFNFIASVVNIWNEGGTVKNKYEIFYIVLICSLVVAGFILSPIKNGFFKLCYSIVNGEKADFNLMFYFFKRNKLITTIQFNLLITLKIILNLIVGFIPYFVVKLITYFFSIQLLTTVGANEIFFEIQTFLFAFAATFALLRSLRLFITEFLYIENEDDFSQIFSASKKINKKHSKDLVFLFFTFLAWIASCFFVIPAFYVIPYFITSFANSSKWLIRLYKDGKIV